MQIAPGRVGRHHGHHRAVEPCTPAAARGPARGPRSDVAALRLRHTRVRDRGQAARALGDGALLDAHRLPAHAPAQPAGRVRRPHRHHHGEAARCPGRRWAGTSTPTACWRTSTPPRSWATWRAPPGPRSCSAPPSWARARWCAARPQAQARRSTSRPGIWDIDLYGELALRWGERDRPGHSGRRNRLPPETIAGGLPGAGRALYPVVRRTGVKSQVVGGATYSRKYNDNDVFNIGVEYFYNPLGYDDADVYPGLILPHTMPLEDPATFFYLGRHYGALSSSTCRRPTPGTTPPSPCRPWATSPTAPSSPASTTPWCC